jgi:hypothetical protein
MQGRNEVIEAMLRSRIASAVAVFPDIPSLGGEPGFTQEEIEQAIATALPYRSSATGTAHASPLP